MKGDKGRKEGRKGDQKSPIYGTEGRAMKEGKKEDEGRKEGREIKNLPISGTGF
jgi:hypothetical protein